MVTSGFSGSSQSGTINRGMVIGIGQFGARSLAHIWDRIRFEDYQRTILRPNLPSIRRALGFSLVLPMEKGGFTIGSPDPNHWDDKFFIRRLERLDFVAWDEKDSPQYSFYTKNLHQSLRQDKLNIPGTSSISERASYFQSALDYSSSVGDFILQYIDVSRVDQDAPGYQSDRFNIYIIAGLHEPDASSFLWPLTMILRQRLEKYLHFEVIGFLSTGAYGDLDERRNQGATIYAALRELDNFMDPTQDYLLEELTDKFRDLYHDKYFDHCYLIDSEKQNFARSKNEEEIIVAIGNAIETLVISDASNQIEAQIGPDEQQMRQFGPFSTMGTASIFIPIDDWNARNKQKHILEIIQTHFLIENEEIEQQSQIDAQAFINRGFSIENLTRRMIRDCPFIPLKLSQGKQSRGIVGRLLQESHLRRPFSGKGPSIPIPIVRIDPELTSLEYIENDVTTRRQYRLDPQFWLGHLFRYYRRLGLDEEIIFPGDPELQAMRANTITPDRTNAEVWFETMITACDSRKAENFSDPSDPMDTPDIIFESNAAMGIIPEMDKFIRQKIVEYLKRDNQGLQSAIRFTAYLSKHFRILQRQAVDYFTRLTRALNSSEMIRLRQRSTHYRLRYRRLLNNRPHFSGLFSRGLLLASFVALLLYIGVPYINPMVDYARLPLLSVTAGSALSGAVGLLIWVIHRQRLVISIERIERDLTQILDLQINHDIGRLIAGDANHGLLFDINQLLVAYSDILREAHGDLTEREEDLLRDLNEPLSLQQPFLRFPLPGLEDIERQLQEEARGKDVIGIPNQLLNSDPERVISLLDPFIKEEVQKAQGDQAIDNYSRTYYSLGDLILSAIERFASRCEDISPPADMQIEKLMRSRLPDFTPQKFLNELQSRTRPMLRWDDEVLDSNLPIQIELLSIDEPVYSQELAQKADEIQIYPVSSLDPFAITCLRLVHGLSMNAVPHYSIYKNDFIEIGPTDRDKLAIIKSALSPTGDYLGINDDGK